MSVADVALSPIHKGSVHSSGYCDKQPKHYSAESVLIYLSVSDSVIPMLILESDSVATVKLRIQTCSGFVVRKQKLVFGGRELARNSSLVKDYGVTGGNVLHLVLKLPDLLLVTVRTTCGEIFEFHVDRRRNVGYLKKRISKEGKGFPDVDDQEIFCNGEKLDDHKVIDDICKDGSSVIHLLVKKPVKVRALPFQKNLELSVVTFGQKAKREDIVVGPEDFTEDLQGRDFLLEPVIVNPTVNLSKTVWDMINHTIDGLDSGNQPIRSSEGTGGTYLMQDSLGLDYISVFKPIDEEPMAVNNPQGLPVSSDGQGLKRGTKVGEGAFREVAAYILDHPKSGHRTLSNEVMGFAGVPPTVLVRSLHKTFNYPRGFEISTKNAKIGSLQMFVKNKGSCEDIGPGAFPVEEVHKICVLDVRLANADRHVGNILFRKGEDGQIFLIPIDHGYCLPENFEDCTFDWLYWPQSNEPFSPETLNYIRSLDSEQDIALLKFHGWDVPKKVSRVLHVSTMLLKKGAEQNLTPYDIGTIMCRENENKESIIEEIVKETENSLLPGMSEAAFLEAISEAMDIRLNRLTK